MEAGTRFLMGSALRALHPANARRPIATDGPLSIPAFAFGWPASELPTQHIAAYATVAAHGIGRGALRSKAGRLGLGLTAAAMAALWQEHRRMEAADAIVEQALIDALGADYRHRSADTPVPPTASSHQVWPSKRVHRRYVHDERVVYGEHGRRTSLDVWRRPDLPADAGAPVLAQIHGGAWVVGDQTVQAYPLMSHLVERGWVCVSATYRLSPKARWPAHIEDVKRALAWTKQNLARYGGDPSWVAITGGSAGGHLVSLAALTPNDPRWQPGFEDADTSVDVAVPLLRRLRLDEPRRQRAQRTAGVPRAGRRAAAAGGGRRRARGRLVDQPRASGRRPVPVPPRRQRQPRPGRPGAVDGRGPPSGEPQPGRLRGAPRRAARLRHVRQPPHRAVVHGVERFLDHWRAR